MRTTTPIAHEHRARGRACRAVAGVILGVVGLSTLFVVGETFDDPGGWAAVGLVALWLVPMAVLIGLAAWRPDLALTVDTVVSVVVALGIFLGGLDVGGWGGFEDDHGPVRAIALVALAGGLGALAWTRPRAAGRLLTLLGGVGVLGSVVAAGSAPLLVFAVPILGAGALLWGLAPPRPPATGAPA